MLTKSKLQTLSEDCSELLFYSEKLEMDGSHVVHEYNRAIKQALRKIVIANEIADRMIICITGLQGTGKTTLMKNFYDLDDDSMNITIGRGERLPVFITEDSAVNRPEMYAVGIEKKDTKYVSMQKNVSQPEFVEMSKGEDDDTTIMYLEIRVPRKYLPEGTKLSYMLLPGYEGKNDYCQTLIDFSVHCSDIAVFTLDPSSISDCSNANLMDKIKNKFGDHMIYVITHSDENEDGNQEYKNTLLELLGTDENNEGRIICTGSYTDGDKNREWKERLNGAIERYSADPASAGQRNSEYIKNIIRKELQPATYKIKKYVTDVTAPVLIEFKHSSWLEAFDKSTANIREKYEQLLTDKLMEAQSSDEEKLRELLSNESILQACKRSLFGVSLKEVKKAQQMIEDAMRIDYRSYRYSSAFSAAIAECTDLLCTGGRNRDNEDKWLVSFEADKDSSAIRTVMQDINTILSNHSKKEILVAKDPKGIMGAIAECGTRFFGLATINELYSDPYITVPNFAKSTLTQEKIRDSIRSTKNFISIVLGLTGFDLIGDNQIDFIPILAKTLGVSVSAAGGITASFIGVGTAVALIKDYNKMQLEDYYSYKKVISSVYDKIKKDYLGTFDVYMKGLRRKVEQYLIDCEGDNEKAIHKHNAKIAICNIQMDLDDIYKGLKNDDYALTKLIRN